MPVRYLNSRAFSLAAVIVASLINTSPLLADIPLMQFDEDGLRMQLSRGDSGNLELKLKAPPHSKVSVFDIEKPNRVVVDLKNAKVRSPRSKVDLQPNGAISAVRMGSHPDKLRIVLDLKSGSIPRYSWNERGNVITLQIPDQGGDLMAMDSAPMASMKRARTSRASDGGPKILSASRQQKPVSNTARTAATKPAEITAPQNAHARSKPSNDFFEDAASNDDLFSQRGPELEDTSAFNRPRDVKKQEPRREEEIEGNGPLASHSRSNIPLEEITDRPFETGSRGSSIKRQQPAAIEQQAGRIVNQPPRPIQGDEKLLGLSFDYAEEDNQPVIKLSLTGRPQFFLLKKDSRTYRLIVPNYRLANNQQALPQFPPQDFKGFTMAVAKQKEKGVEILIGVEDGTRVTAFAKDAQVWVKKL